MRMNMRFVIVTGMSGAGKSSVLKMLEDIGYFCVDNLPVKLIPKLTKMFICETDSIEKLALGIDIRNLEGLSHLDKTLNEMRENGYPYEILFLDADSNVLVKRYKETRRNHPLALQGRVDKAILSFGFKYGIPADCDLVFDVRFLPNPYYIPELKKKTGNDFEVYDYVMKSEQAKEFDEKLFDMIKFLVPNYITEGKNQLVIGIGCTGGKHRSVSLANALAKHMQELPYSLKVEHRDIEKDAKTKGEN